MTDIYGKFAKIYDKILGGISYAKRADYIVKIFELYNDNPKIILDLACGTGAVTAKLAKNGFDMLGVDLSADMLAIAKQRKTKNVLYIQQDMRELDLFGTVDAVICLCDSLNYILNFNDLAKVFSLVSNYLNPGGLFIFDINTQYKYSKLSNNTFSFAYTDCAYIWENRFYKEQGIYYNEYFVTFFAQTATGLYERFEETHIQRVYTDDEIRQALGTNLKLLNVYSAFTFNIPENNAQRIFYIIKKE